MKTEKKVLYKNTVMLYIMRFSTYFFGFITVPYQTRILGPDGYGKIAVAMALMVYFQLIIDFGFILSATQDVAKNASNRIAIRKIYSSVQYLKAILISISFIILSVLLYYLPGYREDYLFYVIFFVGTVINGLLPDFVYRGLQIMEAITYRILISRTIFTISIFIFLKSESDYMIIPIMNAVGNLVALLWSILNLKRQYNVHLVKVNIREALSHLKSSGTFFLSRIIGTVYTSLNILLLNRIAPEIRGQYAVADKLFSTGQQGLAPISDSIYPYMVKNKDFKLIRRILKILMPVIVVGCTIAYIYAYELMALVFGDEYYNSGQILRALLPAAIATLPGYLYGFPTMAALGIINYANYTVYVSSGIHIVVLLIALFTNNISALFLARLISFSTILDLMMRYIIVKLKFKQRISEGV